MSLDWSHLQSLVAVAGHGSLSAAARALRTSQPTVGRHIKALENELGVKVFERTVSGLTLTPTGTELLEHAHNMDSAANQLSLVAEGRSEAIAGTIRITASNMVSTYILPPIITEFHRQEPDIEIELVATDRSENLLRREADIAVRMVRPTQTDVFTRHLCDLQIGIFATPEYLERRGTPQNFEDLKNHDVIGYDRSDAVIEGFRAVGITVDRSFFSFRSDNQVVAWRMVLAGYGIGFNLSHIGDIERGVTYIDFGVPLPTLPIWLTAHAELKTSRRIRRVYDFLAAELAKS